MAELRFVVDTEQPVQLKSFLRGRNGVSARLLVKLKHREGGITCNGEPVRTIDTVAPGDVIVLDVGESRTAEPNPELFARVVFENESLAVFDKPAGMPVHESYWHHGDTLANYFACLYPELSFRPVHRLDRYTSGLCLVAKDPWSASLLQVSFEKVYYAVVSGVTDECGTIDAPIARKPDSVILRCVSEEGRPSVTHFRRIACDGKYSLLEVRLETGRTHQIRVHMAYIGHPLAGDEMYGGPTDDITRQALHCGRLIFRLPLTGEEVTAEAELPADIRALMRTEAVLY